MRRLSRIFPQGAVAVILYFVLPQGRFQKHLGKLTCDLRRNDSLKSCFVLVGYPCFFIGQGSMQRKNRRFSPKIPVCFRNSFISVMLRVKVGHRGRATCTDREFLEILCETHGFYPPIPSPRRSLPGMIKSRKSLTYRGLFTKKFRDPVYLD